MRRWARDGAATNEGAMITGNCINGIGLILDIAGALLLWRFGLAPSIDRSGTTHIITEQVDEAEVRKGKRYDRFGRTGIALLVLGFVFQLASNFWPRAA
jgi:hypothetical protein